MKSCLVMMIDIEAGWPCVLVCSNRVISEVEKKSNVMGERKVEEVVVDFLRDT